MCRHSYLFIRFFILTIAGVLACSLMAEKGRSQSSYQPPEQPQAMDSVSPSGINSQILRQSPYNLSGKKIAIGQIEPGRPGVFAHDKKILPEDLGLSLAGLFFRDKKAVANSHVDSHAHSVALIMVSQAKLFQGVAPAARLYSAALGSRRMGARQLEQCLTITHVAQQNAGDVRAVNLSFGESLRLDKRPNPILDGNALLTQCLDWSARYHDTLYVVAGNQGKGGIPIPTDQYNGMTIAYTRRKNQVFRKVDFANLGDELEAMAYRFVGRERNLNGRSSVSMVAPGNNLLVPKPSGELAELSGTSFAAPHVTGTVALLQEQGDRMLRTNPFPSDDSSKTYDTSSRRHEVMKAILLNSSEKLRDPGHGQMLGMTKTILGQDNRDWRQSPAYSNAEMPLDPLMGAGQLNAFRAYEQLVAGRGQPHQPVASRGWDYGQVGLAAGLTQGSARDSARGSAQGSAHPLVTETLGAALPQSQPSQAITPGALPDYGDYRTYEEYVIETPLQGGSYFSATLTWDRWVELVDLNKNGEFDKGERFRDRGLNNLDLYLMRVEEDDIRRSVWSSTSQVDSVEHIFQKIPETGRYKLRVQFSSQRNEPQQRYGLAWWGRPVQ